MLKLYQELTDQTIKEISDESSNTLSPIFCRIDSVEGATLLIKNILANEDEDIRYKNITISIDDNADSLPSELMIKLMVKETSPTLDELNTVPNKNSVFIDKIEPQSYLNVWLYINYPGATSLGLLNALQHVYNIRLVVESDEEAI